MKTIVSFFVFIWMVDGVHTETTNLTICWLYIDVFPRFSSGQLSMFLLQQDLGILQRKFLLNNYFSLIKIFSLYHLCFTYLLGHFFSRLSKFIYSYTFARFLSFFKGCSLVAVFSNIEDVGRNFPLNQTFVQYAPKTLQYFPTGWSNGSNILAQQCWMKIWGSFGHAGGI